MRGRWRRRGSRFSSTRPGSPNPRLIRAAPNGDVFVAESARGEILVLRGPTPDGRAAHRETFARGLDRPFGIAFYPPGGDPQWVYVAETDAVVRFPYRSGDLRARGAKQKLATLPGGGLLRGGGHWTRDVAFSLDGKRMFVSVGSRTNDAENDGASAEEHDRADVLEFPPTGGTGRVYAWGIRNAVGIAIQPGTGRLWASVNERDELGDNLVPDYITLLQEGGFYGWPWFYMGGSVDPRHQRHHPDLAAKVITPDVLLQPHIASLELVFLDSPAARRMFPPAYAGDLFAAEHGSWNRNPRAGYEVIRVPLHGRGAASGEYEDFLTGFVTPNGDVWGRPVGVAFAADGALLVSDDAGNCIWRVSTGGRTGGRP